MADRRNTVLGKRGRSEAIVVLDDDGVFPDSRGGEENFGNPRAGGGGGGGDGDDQANFRSRAPKRPRPAAAAAAAVPLIALDEAAPRRVRLTSRPIPRSPSRSPSPDPAPAAAAATRVKKKKAPAALRNVATQGSVRNISSRPPPPPPLPPPSSNETNPGVAVAATGRRQHKAKPPPPTPTPTPATTKRRTKPSESYAERIALDETNRKKWAAERKATPRRRRDRTLKELHCWSLDAARDLPERCIPIPGRGDARTRRDGACRSSRDDENDDERARGGRRGGDGAEGAEGDDDECEEKDGAAATVAAKTRARDARAPKNRTVFAESDVADHDGETATRQEEEKDDDAAARPPPRGARKSDAGVHRRDEDDGSDDTARKKRQRRDREMCILSIDFGIVLSFAVILVSPISLRIVQWQTLRLSEHRHTCEEAAQRAVAYLLTHFRPLPEFDAILLETQPPMKATRTRDMSFAMYGALQSLYACPVYPSPPCSSSSSSSSSPPSSSATVALPDTPLPPPPPPRIQFVDPQLKINLCYLLGCESTKKGTDNYGHNKNIAEVGCRHLMRSLADRGDVDWAADCERWFLSQETLHDLSDCMLQALAWYRRTSTARTLPHEIVPVNEHTSVPPPTPKRVAAPKAAATAAKPKLATEKKSTAPRQSAPESKKKATATASASSTTISKEVLRAARRANLEPAIVMGKRKMKSERKVPVGSLSASPV